MMEEELIRLSKLMSEQGLCSRREADRFIERGLVRVDGEIVSVLGSRVSRDAKVVLLPKAQRIQSIKVTILLNKPLGYVSCQPEKGYREALELITPDNQYKQEGAPAYRPENKIKLGVVGRLDIDSKGLLIFTQDGVLAKKIIGAQSEIEKEYIVRVEEQVSQEMIQKLRYGLSLDGELLKPASINQLQPHLLRFILKQGKKRQIRRMCELVGLKVQHLKRVRVGNLLLGDLPDGQWRYLLPSESI
jgi:23S rRNA pseudouridine2604 synthase